MTAAELEAEADRLLFEDARSPVCSTCEGRGTPTGTIVPVQVEDAEGHPLDWELLLQVYECSKGHRWHDGEGTTKGISGANPILFERNLITRTKREVYVSDGVPDPAYASGIFSRPHREGRRRGAVADG